MDTENSSKKKLWHVVKFSDEKVGIIPDPWLLLPDKTSCQYPKTSNRYYLNKITAECDVPNPDWEHFQIVKFYRRDITDLTHAKAELFDLNSESSETAASPQKKSPQKNRSNNSKVSSTRQPTIPAFPTGSNRTRNNNGAKNGTQTSNGKPGKTGNPQDTTGPSPQGQTSNGEPGKTANPQDTSGPSRQGPKPVLEEPLERSGTDENEENVICEVNFDRPKTKNNEQVVASGSKEGSKEDDMLQVRSSVLKRLLRQTLGSNKSSSDKSSKAKKQKEANKKYAEMESELLQMCPFKELAQFEKFDHKLKRSKKLRNRLRSELEVFKGDKPDETSRSMIGAVVSDEVASLYSYKGQKNCRQILPKKSFKATKLCELVFKLVNFLFPNEKMTTLNFKSAIADWFAQAPYRMKRRALRGPDEMLCLEDGISSSSSDSDLEDSDEN